MGLLSCVAWCSFEHPQHCWVSTFRFLQGFPKCNLLCIHVLKGPCFAQTTAIPLPTLASDSQLIVLVIRLPDI